MYDNIVVMSEVRGAAVYEVLRHVRPLLLSSVKAVESMLRHQGLSVGTRAVLEWLWEQGPAPVPTVANSLGLTRQAVQRHVNDLRGLGYVEPRPNPSHQRSVLITLTDAGAATYTRIKDDELCQLAQLAPACTGEELATAARVLRALSSDIRDRPHPTSRSEGELR
jgi:DNA-binding MarR family transcriptional regulator